MGCAAGHRALVTGPVTCWNRQVHVTHKWQALGLLLGARVEVGGPLPWARLKGAA